MSDTADGASTETVDVDGLVARVDSLLGDLGHLVEDVESAEDTGEAAGLDLTLVLPTMSPSSEDLVPDHGSAGPQVDLFAVAEETEPVSESTSSGPQVVLETETSVDLEPSISTAVETAMPDVPTSTPAETLDDEPGHESGTIDAAQAVEETTFDIASETEDALLEAMAEEFGQEPVELPPIEDEGDPFPPPSTTPSEPSEAARRLEALFADRLAEEFELVEEAATTTPRVIESPVEEVRVVELAPSDIDAVARAEMEALEALGTSLDAEIDSPRTDAAPEARSEGGPEMEEPLEEPIESPSSDQDFTSQGLEERPADVVDATSSPEVAVVVAQADPEADEDAVATEVAAEEPADVSDSHTDSGVSDSDELTETVAAAESRTDRPKPVDDGPSFLVRIGAAPFRFVPRGLHRHATSVAVSLVAWIPLAWGFAILSPESNPPTLDVLRAGFDVDHHVDVPTGDGRASRSIERGESASASASATATSPPVDPDLESQASGSVDQPDH